jgi:hypothetical protein
LRAWICEHGVPTEAKWKDQITLCSGCGDEYEQGAAIVKVETPDSDTDIYAAISGVLLADLTPMGWPWGKIGNHVVARAVRGGGVALIGAEVARADRGSDYDPTAGIQDRTVQLSEAQRCLSEGVRDQTNRR